MHADWMKSLPYTVHTNMELGLMLRGLKPLAFFMEDYSRTPERLLRYFRMFDRHVASGRFVKREHPVANAARWNVHYILYALPSEEWRIESMIELRERPGPWSADRERAFGQLLGYEEWMNDVWLARYPVGQASDA